MSLEGEDRTLAAKKKAMRLLEQQDRSEAGLREKLFRAGFTEEEAWEALSYVRSYGYLDDRRFAENFIRTHLSTRSRQWIFQSLSEKGVDREITQNAWEEVAAEEEPDEDALIRKAIQKRCPEGIPEDAAGIRRLYGYLARRGFSYSDVRRVLDLPLEE